MNKKEGKKTQNFSEKNKENIEKINPNVTKNTDKPLTQGLASVQVFQNIDQVKSESTNLIDESTKQLSELMKSITKTVTLEENLFKSTNTVNAACNCAKQISSLLRVKLDIYREYKKSIK